MIYQGKPTQDCTQLQGLIKYNTQEIIWGCAERNYKVKPQDKGNIIQHALKTHKLGT